MRIWGMDEMDKKVAVYLLTGFLGSGKTTLLRRLIADAEARGWKPAVLMNEVGDVNLDGLAVGAQVPMAELLGGCICCTVKSDAGLELVGLIREHAPDVVFVESTGVAQPLEIIDAISEASLYAAVELWGVIAVADARHLLDRVRVGAGKTLKLMRDQIRTASLVLLNKVDLIGEAERAELADWIREWNPHAVLQTTVRCEADWDSLWNPSAIPMEGETREESERRPDGDPGHDHNDEHAHRNHEQDRDHGQSHLSPEQDRDREHVHRHYDHDHAGAHRHRDHDHVSVMTHYLRGPVDSEKFERFLRELPEGVYRAKGIVTFTDAASRFLFQYAYRESDFMRITPQKTVHDVAVFIGENFSSRELTDKLEAWFGEAG